MGNLTYRDFRLRLDKEANRYTVSLPFTGAVDYVMEPEDWESSLLGGSILYAVEELANMTEWEKEEELAKRPYSNAMRELYRERCLEELKSVVPPVEAEELLAFAAHWYSQGYTAGGKAACEVL